MKKIVIVSVLALTLGVTACGNTADTAEMTVVQTTVAQTTIEQTTVAESTSAQETPVQPTTIQETEKMTETVNVETTAETEIASEITEATTEASAETESISSSVTEEETTVAPTESIMVEGTTEPEKETTVALKTTEVSQQTNSQKGDFVSAGEIPKKYAADKDRLIVDSASNISGEVNKDGYTWYQKYVWVASNGYKLKIADYMIEALMNVRDPWHDITDIYIVGDEDRSDGSAWSVAVDEYLNDYRVPTSMGGPDMNGNTWYKQITWTASNGYQVKIADQSELVYQDSHSRIDIYIDGTEDVSPNSAWSVAVIEYVYSNEKGFAGGTDRYNPEVVDVSKLPYVSTVSSKQTSLTATAEWNAYKEVFDPMHSFQACGIWQFNPIHMLHLTDDFIGLAADGTGYLWEIMYTSEEEYAPSIYPVDCWRVTFWTNPSELSWHGFHTALKMITPDADAVYEAIYEQAYYGADWILDYEGWYAIPNSSSEIYAVSPEKSSYPRICFK